MRPCTGPKRSNGRGRVLAFLFLDTDESNATGGVSCQATCGKSQPSVPLAQKPNRQSDTQHSEHHSPPIPSAGPLISPSQSLARNDSHPFLHFWLARLDPPAGPVVCKRIASRSSAECCSEAAPHLCAALRQKQEQSFSSSTRPLPILSLPLLPLSIQHHHRASSLFCCHFRDPFFRLAIDTLTRLLYSFLQSFRRRPLPPPHIPWRVDIRDQTRRRNNPRRVSLARMNTSSREMASTEKS